MKNLFAVLGIVLMGMALADERLDYLQGDGTAYIDTKYKLTGADTVEIDFMAQYEELGHLFGARQDANNENFSLSVGSSSGIYSLIADYSQCEYTKSRLQVEISSLTNIRMKATIGNTMRLIERYEGGMAWTNRQDVKGGANLSTRSSCLLFHLNGAPFGGAKPFRGRIYSFKIIQGEETVMELIPYEKNGVCGFKNKTNGEFLTPKEGTFIGQKLGRQAA